MIKIKQKIAAWRSYFGDLELKNEGFGWKSVAIFMIIAYLFGFLWRLTWIFIVHGIKEVVWNNQLIINTPDGLYWGSIAQKALFGLHQSNDWVPGLLNPQGALSTISYLIVKLSSLSLETIMIYLPIFVSCLIVIPIILIGRLYKNTFWGFCSALIASVAWSYYNRTMAGYFDTDMFQLPLVVFILYFLLAAIKKRKLEDTFLAALMIVATPFFYDKLMTIIYAIVFLYIAYSVIWQRKDSSTWPSILLISMVFWVGNIPPLFSINGLLLNWLLNLAIATLTFLILKQNKLNQKIVFFLSLVSIILFIVLSSPLQSMFQGIFKTYLPRNTSSTAVDPATGPTLRFLPTTAMVSEAQAIPFKTLAQRVIGSEFGLLLACLGYLLLIIRKPEFLLGLPLLGVGFFSLYGGLRFTVFAVPIAALSCVYLFWFASALFFQKNTWSEKFFIIVILVSTATIGILYPNIKHIRNFIPKPMLWADQIQALETLKHKASQNDYVITWWDYGSSIWFYSGLKSLAAPSGQSPSVLFLLSEILMNTSQPAAANLSRWTVERYKTGDLFEAGSPERSDPKKFLAEIKTAAYPLPPKTNDVFFFLPIDLLNLAGAITAFSNLDITTGKTKNEFFFLSDNNYQKRGDKIWLEKYGLEVDFDKLTLHLLSNGAEIKTKAFYLVYYDQDGKLTTKNFLKKQEPKDGWSVILMRDQHYIIILDDQLFNSLLIKMLVFEEYDPKLFEPIVMNQKAKIYRLKF